MDILSKRFHAEVVGFSGSKTKISFSGKEALLQIAFAEAMTPIITALTQNYKLDIESKNNPQVFTSDELIARVMGLSIEVDTPDKLSARGVKALTALTEARDKSCQQIFESVEKINPPPKPDLYLQARLTLQLKEQRLRESKQILDFFSKLQAQQD